MSQERRSVTERRVPSSSDLTTYIREYIAVMLGVDAAQIDSDMQLNDTGLGSSAVVSLVGELEEMLDLEISPNVMYEATSIRGAAETLATLAGQSNGAAQ